MQTFLPYEDFAKSASVLDNKRLGKQRVECKQIYLSLTDPDYAFKKHPAVRMWRKNLGSLVRYAIAICKEWRSRGFADSLLPWFESLPQDGPDPEWLGGTIHTNHRAVLLYKFESWYNRFEWTENPADGKAEWPNVRD